MKATTIIGWALIFLGVAVIGYSALSAYQVFTAKQEAPQLFSGSQGIKITTIPSSEEEVASRAVKDALQEMIPADSFAKITNLLCWAIFCTILVVVGNNLAGIGIKLVKSS